MHFIDYSMLNETMIEKLFAQAALLETGLSLTKKPLENTTWLLFFPESSLRTRLTFEKAISDLGGQSILFPPNTLDKKEALKDVIGYAQNWADGIVVRHSALEKIKLMANYSVIPVINAMTSENHPCEILSDLYALKKIRSNYRELNYTFVGEKGNISMTWVSVAKALGLKLTHVCTEGNRIIRDEPFYKFTTDLDSVVPETDVFLTDGLPDCNKHTDYYNAYQITLERLKRAKPNALLNPCPPFTRGEEVSVEAIESEYFVGYEFKSSLLCVQQAILLYCRAIDLSKE